MRPLFIPTEIKNFDKNVQLLEPHLSRITANFAKLHGDKPDVSIIIPAYNEEENILKALYSLSCSITLKKVEVIVVNNNSNDRTRALAKAVQVICINEYEQGITKARNAGLSVAKGTYIINADADTIYPETWIDQMISPLIKDHSIALTYGRFSFIPTTKIPRIVYFIYEQFADINKFMHRTFKEEAVNVYGFNSACRRQQCLQVNGFDHPAGTNEDGWLAIKLRENGFGQLVNIKSVAAIVWTTDRRIQSDGGLLKATLKRLRKNLSYANFSPK